MEWRVIVRVTFNNDSSSKLRGSALEKILGNAGFQNTNWGSWETKGLPIKSAAKALSDCIAELARVSSAGTLNGDTYLESFWGYIERVDIPPEDSN